MHLGMDTIISNTLVIQSQVLCHVLYLTHCGCLSEMKDKGMATASCLYFHCDFWLVTSRQLLKKLLSLNI